VRPGNDSWPWFDVATSAADDDGAGGPPGQTLAVAFTRCFATNAGRAVLRHLCGMTLERTLAPEAPESVLRHLEGQRFIVRYLQQLVERGRAAPGSHPRAVTQINEVDTMPIGEP
jgi:hypothetical protein